MSVSPENWQEYAWVVEGPTGDFGPLIRAGWRVWRVTVFAGVAPTLLTLTVVGGPQVITVPPNQVLTLEPHAMYVGALTATGSPLSTVVEWIRRGPLEE